MTDCRACSHIENAIANLEEHVIAESLADTDYYRMSASVRVSGSLAPPPDPWSDACFLKSNSQIQLQMTELNSLALHHHTNVRRKFSCQHPLDSCCSSNFEWLFQAKRLRPR
jgi:hypothetical protein